MERRQKIFGGRVLQTCAIFAEIIGALILSVCTDSAVTPDATSEPPRSDEIILPLVDSVNGNPPTGPSVDDESPELPDAVKYPTDSEGNDPAGMIVTGLGELAASQIVSPWLVSVRLFRRVSGPSSTGDVSVELTRYAEDFPVSAHIRFFSTPLDTCVIRNSQNEEGIGQTNPPPPGINGGESVVLNMPSGPWFSLNRTRMPDAQWVYRVQDLLPGTLPTRTTLSIPGGAFPTVAAYPLFEAEPVVRLLPANSQSIVAESRYSWIPRNRSAHVKIDFMAYDGAGDFQGYPLSCWVNDDGSFDLPESAWEALESLEMQRGSGARLAVRYSRIYSRVDLIDGIVYHQGMEVAE